MDFYNAVFLVLQMFNGCFRRVCGRSHNDDDLFGVFGTDVINQMILATGDRSVFIHRFLNDGGDFFIIGVGGFANLEEHVRVLSRTANDGVIRRQRISSDLRRR